LPLLAHQTLDQHALAALFPQRIAASVAGSFGMLGLVLSVVGLYALVASQVSGRRHELAVRLALGATRGSLRRLVLSDALATVGAGLAAGALGAAALGRLFSGFLPGVDALDATTHLGAALALALAAMVAADAPARRAAGTDPIKALRAE
jgi:ABC-type antimicrobial peptide transport system permease subunit